MDLRLPPLPLLRRLAVALLLVDLILLAMSVVGRAPARWTSPLTAAITVTMFALLWLLLRRQQRLAERQQQMLDALTAAVVVWDADDRLVFANRDFRAVYAPLADLLVPGARFESLMRAAVERGLVPQAEGRLDEWLAERMREHRAGDSVTLRQLPGGRWRRIVETRLDDGSLIAHSIDVSELVRREAEATAAREEAERMRRLLLDAIEVMPAGFELFDAEDRLVLSNGRLAQMYPNVVDLIGERPSWEALVRHNHELGGLPGAGEGKAFEDWLGEQKRRRAKPSPSRVTQIDGDRWIRTFERRTSDGGLVAVRIDITDEVRHERELTELNAKLDALNAELAELSDTDALTGLANRRRFDRELANEWLRAARHRMPFAVLMVDVDHFKRFNDHHGHPAGDACLRRVAQALGAALGRSSDLLARFGGEEFVLLLPQTDAAGARAVAARCIAAVDAAAIVHGDSPVAPHVTVSIGGAAVSAPEGTDASALLAAADEALYRAKAAGRRCVRFATGA